MPAPVTSSSSARTVNDPAMLKPRPQTKKRRVVRRRGRAKGVTESDDEIVREVGTDSDTADEVSSLDSDSDSDTEPVSDDIAPNGHSRTFTPSTSQSPADRDGNEKGSVMHVAERTPFFSSHGNWSEMVAEENHGNPADLPVIEFSEFAGDSVPQSQPAPTAPRKGKKNARNSHSSTATDAPQQLPSSTPTPGDQDGQDATPPASLTRRSRSSSSFKRLSGQSARQAYQQRLENDPSYVPTVGGFWGHDDRLLDKDLRSLSGWWRGRWQGRGRGRGFFMRGRGRGAYSSPPVSHSNGELDIDTGEPSDADATSLLPIERPWTHDGFEEMKRKEEQRRAAQQTHASPPTRGVNGFRGRGTASFRGSRGGFARGGSGSPSRGRVNLPFANPGRIWYSMKPEQMWTKQHEGFLFFESYKFRHGLGARYRVRLPGYGGQVVRSPAPAQVSTQALTNDSTTTSVLGSDVGERSYAVRLPLAGSKKKEKEVVTERTAKDEEAAIEEIFTVRPRLVVRTPIPLPDATSVPSTSSAPRSSPSSSSVRVSVQSKLEQLTLEVEAPDPSRQAKTEEAVLKKPAAETETQSPNREPLQPPPLPAIQTVFTPPPPQASPVYGSPYGYVPLPPGVAINQHGMTYELATGRPVYLQPHPPPPVYNPRPMMPSHVTTPSVSFVPGHMHHPSAASVSPDILPHTPPMMNGFFDPTTGTPLFSLPRQSSRIKIRAPDGTEISSPHMHAKSPQPQPLSSHQTHVAQRSVAATAQSPASTSDGYFPLFNGSGDPGGLPPYGSVAGHAMEDVHVGTHAHQHQHAQHHHRLSEQGMAVYAHYPQHYYYPDAYGYAPYLEMSQAGQYDMYSMDPHAPHGTVYY